MLIKFCLKNSSIILRNNIHIDQHQCLTLLFLSRCSVSSQKSRLTYDGQTASQSTIDHTKPKPVWKSSLKQQQNDNQKITEESSRLNRAEAYKKFNLDSDFSHIKEEIPLFEISSPATYRGYFILIVFNFIFWTACADILYVFYSKLEKEEKILQRQAQYEQTKHDLPYLDRIKEYFSVYGLKNLTKWMFGVIGLGTSLMFMYLLTRCVSFIRLLPGGRQIKVGLINWRGGIDPKRFQIFDLKNVTTREHRLDLCHYITMLVKNRRSNLLIDRQGKFPNETVYDLTVGLRRNLKQSK